MSEDEIVVHPRVLLYVAATGEILQESRNVPEDMVSAQAYDEGIAVLVTDEGDGGSLYYVDDGEVAERPALAFDRTTIAADGDDVAVLTVGQPFTALIDGEPVEVGEDGVLEIATLTPGTYAVEVALWPYLPLHAEIVAE